MASVGQVILNKNLNFIQINNLKFIFLKENISKSMEKRSFLSRYTLEV